MTGASVRITPERPLDRGIGSDAPDLSEPARNTASCPFCEPAVGSATPTFPTDQVPFPRLNVGTSLIFPNLSPYGRHSAVLTFSADHYIPLGRFSKSLYVDALTNISQYIRWTAASDPLSHRVAVTQNILPSSGGALFHPHMQVNLDPEPMGYHAAVLRSQARWEEHQPDSSLLNCWARQESQTERYVATFGPWVLLSAYAPTAQEEFQFIHQTQPSSWSDPAHWDVENLAAMITAVQRFWATRGQNSAHVVLFHSLTGEHPTFGRLLLRATYAPWYRNDQSCYEVGCWEPSRDVSPELLAQQLRAFVTQA